MQRLEVSGAVRPLYGSLGVKGLTSALDGGQCLRTSCGRFTPPPQPPGGRPGTHPTGGRVGPKAGVGGCGVSPPPHITFFDRGSTQL
jgi:hypothetical protein